MKAVVCRELGPPDSLAIEDRPSPSPGPGEVLVAVRAAGVNFADTLIVEGRYQLRPDLPFSPGSELAGVIARVGEGVTGWAAGDEVIAFTAWGAFAEEVVVDARRLVRKPPAMPFEEAAGFLVAHGTSHYALRERARMQPGETLLVLGASGGVGLSAVELGATMGARVIAAASAEEKLAVCRERGAHDTIDLSREDLRERVRDVTGGAGADVIYDPVGGDLAEPALRSCAWGGRYLVIGFAAGEIPRIPLNLTLLKSCSIVGVFWGAFTEREPGRHAELMQELTGWVADGKVRPLVSRTLPLERAAEALAELRERRARGKIVLTMGGS